LTPQRWYEPTDRGLEQRIAERLQQLRARNLRASPTKDTT